MLWLAERLIGQPDFQLHNHCMPQEIHELASHIIEDICAGPEHSLALGSNGEVWGWGQNGNGQLGLGHTNSPVREPTRVACLDGVSIRQVGSLAFTVMVV